MSVQKIQNNKTLQNSPVIFSFFSGSGFLDLGFESAGYEIAFVNEISPSFLSAYKFSRLKMGIQAPKYGYFNLDINNFLNGRKEELRNFVSDIKNSNRLVGFIGGPPCPDFSIAGKNKGADGLNGRLSLAYINLIVDIMPDFFLFENVKGLWSTTKHREFF
ncbi:MAG: DNA cytosine methyltransferase, partial [Clostridiales bacterium]|nr:DNA cytosine methyltransferase [Clostridiales bacterium]